MRKNAGKKTTGPDEATPEEDTMPDEATPDWGKNRANIMTVRYGIGVCGACGNAARARIGDRGRCPACGAEVTVAAPQSADSRKENGKMMRMNRWTTGRNENPDEDLRRRQQDHLRQVGRNNMMRPSDCKHNQCRSCVGTGVRIDGSRCVHSISCLCARCTPRT